MDSSRDIVRKLREQRILNERNDYSEMDHKDLVKLAQDGDQLALETLMKEYEPAIEKVASKFIFDSGDHDDAVQIARIGFWEAVQNWEGKGSFGSYANLIMDRKLTDQLRKDSAGKELIHSQAASMDAPVGTDDEGGEMTLGAALPSKSLSPEEEYLGNDGAKKIMDFLKNELSDVERQCIMKYIKGYKVSEIAEEENMKYKTVENAIMRVKNKLADYMRNVRESKRLRLSESIFSDEEKQVLMSVLSKIDGDMNESNINEAEDLSYLETLTPEEFEDKLSEIYARAEEIDHEREGVTDNDEAGEFEIECNHLLDMLCRMEDCEAVEEFREDVEDARDYILKVIDHVYDDVPHEDPYASRGHKRSDFF